MADDSVSRPVGNRFISATDDEICDIINGIMVTKHWKGEKIRIGKEKYPFYQAIARQHSYIRWNYYEKINTSTIIIGV
jgi:hypothetical protein